MKNRKVIRIDLRQIIKIIIFVSIIYITVSGIARYYNKDDKSYYQEEKTIQVNNAKSDINKNSKKEKNTTKNNEVDTEKELKLLLKETLKETNNESVDDFLKNYDSEKVEQEQSSNISNDEITEEEIEQTQKTLSLARKTVNIMKKDLGSICSKKTNKDNKGDNIEIEKIQFYGLMIIILLVAFFLFVIWKICW